MKLYLDDDSVSGLLCRLLRQEGHDVQIPLDVGLSGHSDPIQLTHAIREKRILLSSNHDDFRELHELVLEALGAHSGILIVRYDNDRRRDLTPTAIVRAIRRVVEAEFALQNQFVILNQWR